MLRKVVYHYEYMDEWKKSNETTLPEKELEFRYFYGWAMSQKLSVNKFEWIEDASTFNGDFIKLYNEESDEGYFLGVAVQYIEKLHKPHNDLPFLPERMKIDKVKKLIT